MLADCLTFLQSGFYKVERKMSLSIVETQRGPGCDSTKKWILDCWVDYAGCSLPHQALPSLSLGQHKNGNVVNVWAVWLTPPCVLTHSGGRGGCHFPRRGLRSVTICHSVTLPVRRLQPHFWTWVLVPQPPGEWSAMIRISVPRIQRL